MIKLFGSFLGFTDNIPENIHSGRTKGNLNNNFRYGDYIAKRKEIIIYHLQDGFMPCILENYSYYSEKTESMTIPKKTFALVKDDKVYKTSKIGYEFALYLIKSNLISDEDIKTYLREESLRLNPLYVNEVRKSLSKYIFVFKPDDYVLTVEALTKDEAISIINKRNKYLTQREYTILKVNSSLDNEGNITYFK